MNIFKAWFLLFPFVAMSTFVVHAQSWSGAAPMPVALQEIYTDTLNDDIYVAGGIPAKDAYVSDQLLRYSAKNNQWTLLAPMPVPGHHVTVSAIANSIYAVGGFSGQFPDWQAQASVYRYSPEEDRWSSVKSLPSPRGEHVSAVVNNKLFIIGGRVRALPDSRHFETHVDTKFNHMFDPKTDAWLPMAPALTARNSAAAAAIDGKIYVVGGRQYQKDKNGKTRIVNLPSLEVYDPQKNRWQSKAVMPLAQGGLAAAAANGKLYVFGGEQWYPDKKLFANAWVYDPKTDRWQSLKGMPKACHGLAAAAIGSEIFVFGGATTPGIGAVSDNEKLSLEVK